MAKKPSDPDKKAAGKIVSEPLTAAEIGERKRLEMEAENAKNNHPPEVVVQTDFAPPQGKLKTIEQELALPVDAVKHAVSSELDSAFEHFSKTLQTHQDLARTNGHSHVAGMLKNLKDMTDQVHKKVTGGKHATQRAI